MEKKIKLIVPTHRLPRVKYTYYRIDFDGWDEDYSFTIVETLDDVRDYLQFADIYFDGNNNFKFTVSGVGLTVRQYQEWFNKIVKKMNP